MGALLVENMCFAVVYDGDSIELYSITRFLRRSILTLGAIKSKTGSAFVVWLFLPVDIKVINLVVKCRKDRVRSELFKNFNVIIASEGLREF